MVDKLAKCLLAIFVNQLSCVMYIAMTMTSSFMKRNKKVCVRGNLVSYVIIRFVFCRNGRDEMFTRIMYAEKIKDCAHEKVLKYPYGKMRKYT